MNNYAASISLAQGYLESRGIPLEVARLAQLGVVAEPDTGHEQYTGRLSIPYITKTGVVDLRFRSLNPAVEPKYMGMVGVDTSVNVSHVVLRCNDSLTYIILDSFDVFDDLFHVVVS